MNGMDIDQPPSPPSILFLSYVTYCTLDFFLLKLGVLQLLCDAPHCRLVSSAPFFLFAIVRVPEIMVSNSTFSQAVSCALMYFLTSFDSLMCYFCCDMTTRNDKNRSTFQHLARIPLSFFVRRFTKRLPTAPDGR